MSEQEFNQLFAKNLRYYLLKNDMNQNELATRLEVSTTSVSNWCKGTKVPRMDKVDAICKIFGIKRSDLMEDHNHSNEEEYYLNPETRKIAQEIYDNPALKSLFDMSRKMTPERLKAHIELMKQLMGNDGNN